MPSKIRKRPKRITSDLSERDAYRLARSSSLQQRCRYLRLVSTRVGKPDTQADVQSSQPTDFKIYTLVYIRMKTSMIMIPTMTAHGMTVM